MSRYFELLKRAERDRGNGHPRVPHTVEVSTKVNAAAVSPALSTTDMEVVASRRLDRLGEEGQRQVAELVEELFLLPSGGTRSAVVTGVDPECQTGRITATAAEVLADSTTGLVCVIDANLFAPSLHAYFGVSNSRGLSEILGTSCEVAHAGFRVSERLWLISSGDTDSQRMLVGSEQMRRSITEFLFQFNFVLINAPSVEHGNYAVSIGRMTDGAVLVLEADSTRRDTAQRAKKMLESGGVPVLGAVLNNRKYPIPAGLYNRL